MFEGLAWAEMVLRDQEMPPDELRVVLTTADRELVRHHLELHLERLEEWLSNQRRRVAAVERIVAEAIERPPPGSVPSPAVAIVHASVDLEASGTGDRDGRRSSSRR